MPRFSIRDRDGGQELLIYNETLGAYLPRLPFYVCAKCFETLTSMRGSMVSSYTCTDHPESPTLFSLTNPNVARIPVPSGGSGLFDESDSDDGW